MNNDDKGQIGGVILGLVLLSPLLIGIARLWWIALNTAIGAWK